MHRIFNFQADHPHAIIINNHPAPTRRQSKPKYQELKSNAYTLRWSEMTKRNQPSPHSTNVHQHLRSHNISTTSMQCPWNLSPATTPYHTNSLSNSHPTINISCATLTKWHPNHLSPATWWTTYPIEWATTSLHDPTTQWFPPPRQYTPHIRRPVSQLRTLHFINIIQPSSCNKTNNIQWW